MGDLFISDFIVVDCETTFCQGYGQIPIEIGAVRYRNGSEIARFSTLANGGIPIAGQVEKLTGIKNDDLLNAPDLNKALNDFFAFVGDEPCIVGHNIKYDYAAILSACHFCHIDAPDWSGRMQDTMEIAAGIFRHNSLENCARWLGVEQQNAHRAADDSKTTAELFLALQKENKRIKSNSMSWPSIGKRIKYSSDSGFSFSGTKEQRSHHGASPRDKYLKRIREIIDNARESEVDFTDIHFAFHGDLKDPEIFRVGGLDQIVEELGGTFHKNVSGKVDFYVCFDDEETQTVMKAREIAADPKYHLHIIGTEDFLEMLAYETDEPNLEDAAQVRLRKLNEQYEREALEKERIEKARLKEERKKDVTTKSHDNIEPKNTHHIIQLSLDGQTIKTFSSVADAAHEVGVDRKCIRDAANGKQKTAGGFKWKFIDGEVVP